MTSVGEQHVEIRALRVTFACDVAPPARFERHGDRAEIPSPTADANFLPVAQSRQFGVGRLGLRAPGWEKMVAAPLLPKQPEQLLRARKPSRLETRIATSVSFTYFRNNE